MKEEKKTAKQKRKKQKNKKCEKKHTQHYVQVETKNDEDDGYCYWN